MFGACSKRVKSPGPWAGAAGGGGGAEGLKPLGSTDLNIRVNSPEACEGGGAIGFVIGLIGAGVDCASGDWNMRVNSPVSEDWAAAGGGANEGAAGGAIGGAAGGGTAPPPAWNIRVNSPAG